MPLCQYPEAASHVGGDVNVAASWVCKATDQRMMDIWLDGRLAHVDGQPRAR
jgi:hypothetical protein